MIKHIVMWKIADLAEGKSKLANAAVIRDMLMALPKTIPQIQEIEVGINFNDSDAAYDVVLYSVFKSKEDLEIYQKHPDHQRVGGFIAKVRTDRAVVDYEV